MFPWFGNNNLGTIWWQYILSEDMISWNGRERKFLTTPSVKIGNSHQIHPRIATVTLYSRRGELSWRRASRSLSRFLQLFCAPIISRYIKDAPIQWRIGISNFIYNDKVTFPSQHWREVWYNRLKLSIRSTRMYNLHPRREDIFLVKYMAPFD